MQFCLISNINDVKVLGVDCLKIRSETPTYCCLFVLSLCQSVSNFTQYALEIKALLCGAHRSSCIKNIFLFRS